MSGAGRVYHPPLMRFGRVMAVMEGSEPSLLGIRWRGNRLAWIAETGFVEAAGRPRWNSDHLAFRFVVNEVTGVIRREGIPKPDD